MTSAPTQPLVEVRKVWKSFGDKQVLRGVSFALPKGTILAVMGGSGSGKTVLLRITSGLAQPDSGEVRLFGTRIDRMSEEAMLPLRRRSGFVFQGAALFDSLTVFENVAFPLREKQRGIDREELRARVVEKLRVVDLGEEILGLWPAQLSGGEQARVMIARLMLEPADLLLLDEPCDLDPDDALLGLSSPLHELRYRRGPDLRCPQERHGDRRGRADRTRPGCELGGGVDDPRTCRDAAARRGARGSTFNLRGPCGRR